MVANPEKKPFWRTTPLAAMSPEEWESLCDGCGRCCLVKLEDEDTGKIHFTDVACKLFNPQTCRCSDYANRTKRVSDCVKLDPGNVSALNWLPDTCSYRLVARGKDLPAWHPLKTGRASSVDDAGISVRGRTISEEAVSEDSWEARIWLLPRAKKLT
ncbi:YcgN family cysteine cluster protein [soil metagenome]